MFLVKNWILIINVINIHKINNLYHQVADIEHSAGI